MAGCAPYAIDITADLQLDQNDGAGAPAALAAGEAYEAAILLTTTGATVLKGVKAAIGSTVKPTVPADAKLRRWVTVEYDAGGTSIIAAGDLAGDELNDRLYARAGAGLEALVDPGDALYGGTWRFWGRRNPLVLTDAADNYLWELANGNWTVTTDLTPPDTTSMITWRFPTAGGVVTEADIEDLRTYLGKTEILRIGGPLPTNVGDPLGDDLVVEHLELHWELTAFRVADNGGGTAGATAVDILVNGVTAYPNSATEDNRPSVAFDAAALVDRDSVHATTILRRGDVVSAQLAARPTGGDPARVEILLVCRVP
ncbi:MAG TPA: hypothetical protein VMT16_09895 [Thermoanaerobaculia bacterium]|nr:hypothetical protein [Thermoanaerobaculia bacterium]